MVDLKLNHIYYHEGEEMWCAVTGFFETCDGDPMVNVVWETAVDGFALAADLTEEGPEDA